MVAEGRERQRVDLGVEVGVPAVDDPAALRGDAFADMRHERFLDVFVRARVERRR